jgi:hypothetical protein
MSSKYLKILFLRIFWIFFSFLFFYPESLFGYAHVLYMITSTFNTISLVKISRVTLGLSNIPYGGKSVPRLQILISVDYENRWCSVFFCSLSYRQYIH